MTRRGGTIGMAADPARQRDQDRRPYTPPKEEWEATWQMLCGHCAHAAGCQVVEAMIAHANGDGPWPEGGWVTDPGAEVTCLSYEPGTRPPMPRQQRRAIARMREAELPSVCPGCGQRGQRVAAYPPRLPGGRAQRQSVPLPRPPAGRPAPAGDAQPLRRLVPCHQGEEGKAVMTEHTDPMPARNPVYVVWNDRPHGAWFRPSAGGYTSHFLQAGIFAPKVAAAHAGSAVDRSTVARTLNAAIKSYADEYGPGSVANHIYVRLTLADQRHGELQALRTASKELRNAVGRAVNEIARVRNELVDSVSIPDGTIPEEMDRTKVERLDRLLAELSFSAAQHDGLAATYGGGPSGDAGDGQP